MEIKIGKQILTTLLSGGTFRLDRPEGTLSLSLEPITDSELARAMAIGLSKRFYSVEEEEVRDSAHLDMLDHLGRVMIDRLGRVMIKPDLMGDK